MDHCFSHISPHLFPNNLLLHYELFLSVLTLRSSAKQVLDFLHHSCRLLLMLEELAHVSLAIEQVLREVPLDLTFGSIFGFQILEERANVLALDVLL